MRHSPRYPWQSLARAMLMLLTAVLLTGCEYKDLCYDHNHDSDSRLMLELDLRLELDNDLKVTEDAHTKIKTPQYMKVCYYHPGTGTLNKTEFVGTYGGELHQTPGTYDMVVYSFGTEWTQIRGEGDINTLEAFTSDITMLKTAQMSTFTRASGQEAPGPVIYTPDHLLVAHRQVEIPVLSGEERVLTITAEAATIVETYGFEVRNVTGVENIASVEVFVTNQARSSFFGRKEKSTEPATIYFPLETDLTTGTLSTTFNTFGKLPGESHAYLHIVITDTGGSMHTVTKDITEQFDNPAHEIIIDEPIDIPTPEKASGSGIAPVVEPWHNEIHEVPIG